ncbi:hypothetical protein [Criblamydia sequanensis]|uniref:Uncharacterized protein n=1 Tax=Candidatus Criblamydia sequanensis CRIB-18 TaxID=1437425 RepID=A0A090D1W8_9BACT|nr:hypothetical protein [Criblamydia sequanensis]CDR34135.1 hypothetical protein CSEC_1315 [Criblamydia sequanensis CRIB-18]
MSGPSSGVGNTQYYYFEEPPTSGPLSDQFQPGGAFYPLPSFPLLVISQTLDPSDVSSGFPSIASYARAINESIDLLRNQLYSSESKESEASKKFYQMLVQRASDLRALSAQVYNAVRVQEAVMKKRGLETTEINLEITQYNSTVDGGLPPTENSAIAALNQAIADYYDPLSLNYLNDAVLAQAYADYTAFAASQNVNIDAINAAITAYNAQIAANNANIDIVNQTRAQFGFPPFEKQDPLPLRDYMPGLPPFPPAQGTAIPLRAPIALAPVLNNPPPDDKAYFDAFVATYQNGMIFLQNFSDKLKNADLDKEFFKATNRGKAILARLGGDPAVPGESQTPSEAPSVGYAATALGLFKTLDLILSQALWDSAMKGLQIPLSSRTFDSLRADSLVLAQSASLNSAGPTVAFLAGSLPSLSLLPYIGIDEAAVNVVFSLSFANEIRNLINGEILHETVLQSLKADPALGNLSQDKISNLAGSFAAGIGVSLGLVSLLQLNVALGTPGLAAQLLSLLPGVQALGSNVLSPPTFTELVGNGFTSSLATGLLVGAGLDRSTAGETIRSALANAGEGPNGFLTALTKALEEAGFDTTAARDLAFQTTLEVLGLLDQQNVSQDQLSQSLLQNAISQDDIKKALLDQVANPDDIASDVAKELEAKRQLENSILKESIENDFRYQEDINRSQIKSNIIADNIVKDQIVREAVTNDIKRRDITLRDIRTAIIRSLVNRGYDIGDAAAAAFGAINSLSQEATNVALLNQNTLISSLEGNLLKRGIHEAEINLFVDALREAIKQEVGGVGTVLGLRALIRDKLIGSFNLDRGLAGRMAAGVDLGIGGGSIGLFNVGGPYLDQASVGEALRQHITGLVSNSLGGDRANVLASRVNAEIISDRDSLLNSIQRNLEVLHTNLDNAKEILSGTVRSGVMTTKELSAFVDLMRDPGNTLIYSVWTGLMYSHDQPGSKKSIDIQG